MQSKKGAAIRCAGTNAFYRRAGPHATADLLIKGLEATRQYVAAILLERPRLASGMVCSSAVTCW